MHRSIIRWGHLFITNVASVGCVFNDTQKVKVLLLPETIKKKSTFRAKALCRELVVTTNSRRRAFARNINFSFIVSGSERTFTFRVAIIHIFFYTDLKNNPLQKKVIGQNKNI